MGDHVKVLAGRYEGDTGLIVRVEDNMAVLFSDLTMHEVSTIRSVQFACLSYRTNQLILSLGLLLLPSSSPSDLPGHIPASTELTKMYDLSISIYVSWQTYFFCQDNC